MLLRDGPAYRFFRHSVGLVLWRRQQRLERPRRTAALSAAARLPAIRSVQPCWWPQMTDAACCARVSLQLLGWAGTGTRTRTATILKSACQVPAQLCVRAGQRSRVETLMRKWSRHRKTSVEASSGTQAAWATDLKAAARNLHLAHNSSSQLISRSAPFLEM